jgi:hypothetical protein
MEPFIISNHLKFLEESPGQECQSMNQLQCRIHWKEIQGDQSATTNTDNCYSHKLNFCHDRGRLWSSFEKGGQTEKLPS